MSEILPGDAEARARRAYKVASEACGPINWPARFRAAAEVARRQGNPGIANYLQGVGLWAELTHASGHVEAIGRTLLGEGER